MKTSFSKMVLDDYIHVEASDKSKNPDNAVSMHWPTGYVNVDREAAIELIEFLQDAYDLDVPCNMPH